MSAWNWGDDRDILETDDIFSQKPSTYYLGFEPSLLDAAEDYLHEPCFYMGCSLKRERVSSSNVGPRQWHCDIEDDRMFRVILYLNSVDDGEGPFEYIDSRRSQIAIDKLAYQSGYISDEAMRPIIRQADWISVRGPAGTTIAFDGTRVFHRVSQPITKDRFSLSLTYSSRHPRQIFRQVRLRAAMQRLLVKSLDERQRACLPAARWI
jgi:hypothetical protein